MNKFKKVVGAFVMIALLTACGEEATTEPSDPETTIDADKAEMETEAIQEEEPMTVDDILQQSMEAMNRLNGFATEMTMTQEMTIPGEEAFVTETTILMEMTQDPIQFYQKAQMNMAGMDNMETELYMVDEGFFFKDGIEDTWFTYPEEVTEELRNLQNLQIDPEEQLALLNEYTDLISVTEDSSHYILSVEGASDTFKAFAEELNGLISDEIEQEFNQLMDQTDISQLDYTIYIDKETFFQTKMDMTMELSLDVEGETLTITSIASSTFSDFDEIEAINIPAEIIETAQEYQVDVSDLEDIDLDLIEEEAFGEDPETETEA